MILVIGGIKGGSGKTTLATNLCVIRSLTDNRILLVDADEQLSARDWAEQREAMGLPINWSTIQLSGNAVRTQLLKLKQDYDDIIVDTGGRDTISQRAALTVADIFLAPFQPRSLDVWTLGQLLCLIDEIRTVNPKLKAFSVLNRADPLSKDNIEAAEILKEAKGIDYIPHMIGSRKVFGNAASEGKSVIEGKIDLKASTEIKHLYDALYISKKHTKYISKESNGSKKKSK